MRIWHPKLLPHLCRHHLLACWREALGCYEIVTKDKKGYRNHPQVKMYQHSHLSLWQHLLQIRHEMLERGYHPKQLPSMPNRDDSPPIIWQTLEEQTELLKKKGCECQV